MIGMVEIPPIQEFENENKSSNILVWKLENICKVGTLKKITVNIKEMNSK